MGIDASGGPGPIPMDARATFGAPKSIAQQTAEFNASPGVGAAHRGQGGEERVGMLCKVLALWANRSLAILCYFYVILA